MIDTPTTWRTDSQALVHSRIAETHDREGWLRARTAGIGGSDAGALLLADKWSSPYTVWKSKVDPDEVERDTTPESAHWGNMLEPVVAVELENRTGWHVEPDNPTLQHHDLEWMLANIDGVVIPTKPCEMCGERRMGPGLLEVKTAGQRWWENEGDYARKWFCQIQHYLAVTGYGHAVLAVLVGGQKFEHHHIDRDDEFIGHLIARERTFWEGYVLTGTPPPLTTAPVDQQTLSRMDPDGAVVEVSDDILDLVTRVKAAKSAKAAAKKVCDELEAQLKLHIGSSSRLTYGGRNLVTYKQKTRTSVDAKKLQDDHPDVYDEVQKELKFRVMRIAGNLPPRKLPES